MSKKSAQVIVFGAPASAIKNFHAFSAQILDLTGFKLESRTCELCFDATDAGAKGILNAFTKVFTDFGVKPASLRRKGKAHVFLKTQAEKTPIEIEVCERLMDHHHVPKIEDGKYYGHVRAPKFHAQIKGQPGIWAAGKSRDEAIGDLIRCHPEAFGITITHLGKLGR